MEVANALLEEKLGIRAPIIQVTGGEQWLGAEGTSRKVLLSLVETGAQRKGPKVSDEVGVDGLLTVAVEDGLRQTRRRIGTYKANVTVRT